MIHNDPYIESIEEAVVKNLNSRPGRMWYIALIGSLLAFTIGVYCLWITVTNGLGTWGINRSVGWGISIVNFIWWIGIGHAGTFISAILLIFRKSWRNAISRIAESMTILAILSAGFFPIVHMGRIVYAFYTVPYPNTRNIWVNFNSPLLWDVFAISGYFIVSLIFWYMGMVPDIGHFRTKLRSKFKAKLYLPLSKIWSNKLAQRVRYNRSMYLMAGLSAALVISVHSIVSMDFATSIVPGWHSTIFPPYFVAGALLSGFAMVLSMVIVIRKVLHLEKIITVDHVSVMNKLVLYLGLFMGFVYFLEAVQVTVLGNENELFVLFEKLKGEYAVLFWLMVSLNVGLPLLFLIKRNRRNIGLTFVVSILINLGMWLERYIIVVSSLEKGYMSSRWLDYTPSLVEVGLFIGSMGFFFTGILILMKLIPIVSFHEIKKDYNMNTIRKKIK